MTPVSSSVALIGWLVSSTLCLGWIWSLVRRRDPALAPAVFYGIGLLLFLIAGIPFVVGNGFYGNAYFWALAVGAVPLIVPVLFNAPSVLPTAFHSEAVRSGRWVLLGLWVITGFGVATYALKYGSPPLFNTGGLTRSAEFYALRMSVTYTQSFADFSLFFYTIPGVAVVVGHALYRAQALSAQLNVVSITGAVILGSMFLHKSYGVYIILSLLLVDACLGRISKRKLLLTSLLGTGMILGWYMFYLRGYPLSFLTQSILFRITTPYILSLDFVLRMFPDAWPFFAGQTYPNPGGLLAFDQVSLSRFIMQQKNLNASGTVPVSALGEGYANFGWFGAAITVGLLTFWVVLLIKGFAIARRRPVAFAGWVVLAISLIDASNQSVFAVLDIKLFTLIGLTLASDHVVNQLLPPIGLRSPKLAVADGAALTPGVS